MTQSGRCSSKRIKRFLPLRAWPWWKWIGCVIILALIIPACTRYNPALFPSYDVLNPGPEVRLNPLSFTAEGNLVVNPAFIAWVDELKQEIIKLRKGK